MCGYSGFLFVCACVVVVFWFCCCLGFVVVVFIWFELYCLLLFVLGGFVCFGLLVWFL